MVSISPDDNVYQLGDRLVCSADGNPPPTYQWMNLITGDVSFGPELAVLKHLANSSSFFQCSATNNVRGKISIASKNISFTVAVVGIGFRTTDTSKQYIFISVSDASVLLLPEFA